MVTTAPLDHGAVVTTENQPMTIVIMLLATFTVLAAATIPPYRAIYQPYKEHTRRRAAIRWWAEQQKQAAIDKKHR